MTTYYVSPNYGVDSNNGLGPDPNHPTDRPWKTVGEALNTGSVISNATANTLWLAPGTYFGEVLIPIAAISSTANPLSIKGDPTNSQGFKTSGGDRVPVGIVYVSNRLATDGLDALPSAASVLVDGRTNGVAGLQWSDLILDSYGFAAVNLTASGNADWSFTRVRFSGGGGIDYGSSGTLTAGRNLTFRGCTFIVGGGMLSCNITSAAATADADLNILFESCLFLGARMTGNLSIGASAGNKAGGIRWKGCTTVATGTGTSLSQIITVANVVSTSTPCRIEGCLFIGGQALSIGTLGQLVSDGYNRFCCGSVNTNITAASTDVLQPVALLVLPDLLAWGLASNINDVFGWGPGSVSTQYASGWNAKGITDYRNRTARPWGGGSSIGYVESTPAMMDTTSQLTGGGAKCLAVYAQGEVSVPVQLDPVATTITVLTKSTAYVGTTWPSAVLQANPSIGVTATTATATSATEQTLTIGPFTPTDAGTGELRLISQNSGNSGWTYFDILQAA